MPQKILKKRGNRRRGGTAKRRSSKILSNKSITKILAPMVYYHSKSLGANTAFTTDANYIDACECAADGFYALGPTDTGGIPGNRWFRNGNRTPLLTTHAIADIINGKLIEYNSVADPGPPIVPGPHTSRQIWQDLLERGHLKTIDWTAGRQGYMESIGIPVGRYLNESSFHTGQYDFQADTCFLSLMQMLNKAKEKIIQVGLKPNHVYDLSTGLGQNTSDASQQPDLTTNIANTIPNILNDLTEMNFKYHGGVQIHKFTNTLNIDAYATFYEYVPKFPLTAEIERTESQSTALRFRGALKLWRYIYRDLQLTLNSTNADTPYLQFPIDNTPTPTYQDETQPDAIALANMDEPSDPDFGYNKRCRLTNHFFRVKKTAHVCIKPGETYTYTMSFNPFFLTDQFFRQMLINIRAEANNSFNNISLKTLQPQYLPLFSKFLQVRFKGARVHGSHVPQTIIGTDSHLQSFHENRGLSYTTSTIAQQPNPGSEIIQANSGNVNTVGTTVNTTVVAPTYKFASTGPGCLLHEMTENHKFQGMPRTFFGNQIKKNLLDGGTSFWDVPNTEPVGNVQPDGDNAEVDMTLNDP